MTYFDKLNALKILEEQKAKLMDNINSLYRTVKEQSGPAPENKPIKHKVLKEPKTQNPEM